MTKRADGLLFDMIALDRNAALPLYRQLDSQLRSAVLSGRLGPGTRLPATRQLASELGVSRLTVQNTYEQLVAEGFLSSTTGAGTFVAEIPPEDLPPKRPAATQSTAGPVSGLSRRGQAIAQTWAATRVAETRPFRPSVPAPELFPMAAWSKLWARALRRLGPDLFGYGRQGGYPPLRAAIAAHLTTARGVRCEPEQVIVTAGSQQSFALCALALLDPGDAAWGEDPGHAAGRDVLAALGITVTPVPIDDEGLSVAEARSRAPTPRLIFVTPSHQHPLGVTMSLRRRLELLQIAQQTQAWVLEDDYDSEFRYSGRPLPALQGLDGGGQVIYAGSFSKVLYPSLRMGYLVVPPALVESFCAAQTVLSQGIPNPAASGPGRLHGRGPFRRTHSPHACRLQRKATTAGRGLETAYQGSARGGADRRGDAFDGLAARRCRRSGGGAAPMVGRHRGHSALDLLSAPLSPRRSAAGLYRRARTQDRPVGRPAEGLPVLYQCSWILTYCVGADRRARVGTTRSAMPQFGRMGHRASGVTPPARRYALPEGPRAFVRWPPLFDKNGRALLEVGWHYGAARA